MRVGVFRRIGAYVLDLIPIIAIISLLFQFLVGDVLKPDNYDSLFEEYNTITADYNDLATEYNTQYDSGLLTEDEYTDLFAVLVEDHAADTSSHREVITDYYISALLYYLISVTLVYYVYSASTKGNTIGRQMMKIELTGKINWWTMFVREVVWKAFYYSLTLFVGGLIVDFFMISFSAKKKAPRDFISKIDVKFKGVDYPF